MNPEISGTRLFKRPEFSKPKVSFVIPVLNAERDIPRCLLSIKRLEFPNEFYEVVIMDNGSTDQTQNIVCNLGFVCHVVPAVKVGALRNQGAAIAQGDYLAFVDADVEVLTGWLQNGLGAFEDPQIVACGCFPGIPKDATWVQRSWDLHQRGCQEEKKPRSVTWLPSMNLLVRRDAFFAAGGFDEQLTTAEDVDLCYRLGQVGTILCNPVMEAIHWGEAADLRTFWRKEVWRGTGNLSGVLAHGMRWDELPSLGYPLYILCFVFLFGASCLYDIWYWQFFFVPLNLGLLMLPALVLTLNKIFRARKLLTSPGLFFLYFVYGLARAFSLAKNIRA